MAEVAEFAPNEGVRPTKLLKGLQPKVHFSEVVQHHQAFICFNRTSCKLHQWYCQGENHRKYKKLNVVKAKIV